MSTETERPKVAPSFSPMPADESVHPEFIIGGVSEALIRATAAEAAVCQGDTAYAELAAAAKKRFELSRQKQIAIAAEVEAERAAADARPPEERKAYEDKILADWRVMAAEYKKAFEAENERRRAEEKADLEQRFGIGK